MVVRNLGEPAIESLIALPETGMGFQLVEATVSGYRIPLLVINSERAIDVSQLGLEDSQDASAILRNGLRIMEMMNSGVVTTVVAAPQPHSFRLLASRISSVIPVAGASPAIALPSSLVKHVKLASNRIFHRFSAFSPDRRVTLGTGSLVAGTFATPESEIPFIPTGFAAVGRLALPNNLPASHHYVIEAPSGTNVDFGTVAPAFGQAGGGVEAYFSNAVTNAKVPPVPASRIPDE
jgi:hypothetical protein